MAGRRVMVTGVASLAGARLAARLVSEGDEVVGLDDLSRGSWALVRDLERGTAGRSGRFRFVEHDVARAIPAPVVGDTIDEAFHLAVPSSRRSYDEAPTDAMLAAVLGTARVLELAAERAMRVVVATSLERWGEGVRCAEAIVAEGVRGRRLDVRTVRLGQVFGPEVPLDDGGVVTRIALAAELGDLTHLGDASLHGRSYRLTWVDDAVESLVRAMRHAMRLPPFLAPTYDVTAERVLAAVLGEVPPPPLTPVPGSAVRPTVPDSMPASFVVGQDHALALEDAVARTCEGLRARIAAMNARVPGGLQWAARNGARNALKASTRVSTPNAVQLASPNEVTPTTASWPLPRSTSAGPPESPKQVLRVRSP